MDTLKIVNEKDENEQKKLRVLVVDQDKQFLTNFVQLLCCCSYTVTAVELPSTALEILNEGLLQFDLMLVEMNFIGMRLLRLADKMGLHTMLMTSKLDSSSIDDALKSGALLLLEKPMTEESIKYISQIMKKEKMRWKNTEEKEKLNRNIQTYDASITLMAENEKNNLINHAPKKRGRKARRLCYDEEILLNGSKLKGKICAQWTNKLHEMFMDAVHSLGIQSTPVEILAHMKVPGLTRMQVASHLQKCRMQWKNENQKSKGHGLKMKPNIDGNGQIQKIYDKKLGSIPFPNHPSNHDKVPFMISTNILEHQPQTLPTPFLPIPLNSNISPNMDKDPIIHQQYEDLPQDVEYLGSAGSGTASRNLITGAINIESPFKDVSGGTFNDNRASSSGSVGVSNFCNPLEMSSLNPMFETLVMPTDPNVATSMIDSLAIASSSQKAIQQSSEFTCMVAEGEEFYGNFAGRDNKWIHNYTDNTRTQNASNDFLSQHYFTMGTNRQEMEPTELSSSFGEHTTKLLEEDEFFQNFAGQDNEWIYNYIDSARTQNAS